MLKGWKSYIGAGLLVIAAGLVATGHPSLAEAVVFLGSAIGIVGLRAKLERLGKRR